MSLLPSLSKSKTAPDMKPSSQSTRPPRSIVRPVASRPGRGNVGDEPGVDTFARISAASAPEPAHQCLIVVVTRSTSPSLSRSAHNAAALLPPRRNASSSVDGSQYELLSPSHAMSGDCACAQFGSSGEPAQKHANIWLSVNVKSSSYAYPDDTDAFSNVEAAS